VLIVRPSIGDLETLWRAWLHAERESAQSGDPAASDRFIAGLASASAELRRAFACDLAQRIVEGGMTFVARRSVFSRFALPELSRGLEAGVGECGTWLASLARGRCDRGAPEPMLDALRMDVGLIETLLRRALALDPDDRRAMTLRAIEIEERLEHAIHETPAYVLSFGNRSATLEDMPELERALAELAGLAERLGMTGDRRELIDACREHFTAWSAYLALPRSGESYARFLENRRRD
jgi:hypothetical protein